MRFVRAWIVVVLIFLPSGAAAQSARCPIDDPTGSPIWAAFDAYVQDTYKRRTSDDTDTILRNIALVYGHAFGRLAVATPETPDDRTAFACAELALDISLAQLEVTWGGTLPSGRLYKLAQEAAQGFHDAEVARISGVTDTSALHTVWRTAYAGRSRGGAGGGSRVVAPPTPPAPPAPPPPTPLPPAGPSVAGTGGMCLTGGRWSLAAAFGALADAGDALVGVPPGANCNAGAWSACKASWESLKVAMDHTFNVFDRNHDRANRCRLCDYDAALAAAGAIREFEKELTSRYFQVGGSADGVYFSIRDNMSDPLCRVRTPPAAPPPPAPPAPPDLTPRVSASGATAPPGGYIIERVEIAKGGSHESTAPYDGRCTRTVKEDSMSFTCVSGKGEYDFTIAHQFGLRAGKGGIAPDQPLFFEVEGRIEGRSKCCSLSNSIWPYFEPRYGREFKEETRSGAGRYTQLKNTNLPAAGPNRPVIGPPRAGSASFRTRLVGSPPRTGDGKLRIVMKASDGTVLMTYHLREVGR